MNQPNNKIFRKEIDTMKISRKIIAGAFALTMIAASFASCTSTDSDTSEPVSKTSASSEEKTESKAEESKTEESKADESKAEESTAEESKAEEKLDYTVEINSVSFSKDYEDKDVMIVEYNFTNNTDKAQSFMFSCTDKAFQNGIECDSGVIGCDELKDDKEMSDIQPNTTVAIKIGYKLQDMQTPVQIEVKDIIKDDMYLKKTIDISDNTNPKIEDTVEDTSNKNTENKNSDEKYQIEIVGNSWGKDYNDKDVLIVEYKFTNNSDKSTSFSTTFTDKAFQNGIECSNTVIGCNDIDTQQQLNDIQPNNSYNIKVGYIVENTNDPVQVTVTEWIGDKVFLDQTVDLK